VRQNPHAAAGSAAAGVQGQDQLLSRRALCGKTLMQLQAAQRLGLKGTGRLECLGYGVELGLDVLDSSMPRRLLLVW